MDDGTAIGIGRGMGMGVGVGWVELEACSCTHPAIYLLQVVIEGW